MMSTLGGRSGLTCLTSTGFRIFCLILINGIKWSMVRGIQERKRHRGKDNPFIHPFITQKAFLIAII